jgi:uncharacterized protein (TIGR02757 family)
MISVNELTDFLESKYLQYNQHSFIDSDPISIPHLYSRKEDIEIAGFLTAIIAWGQRTTIIKNAKNLMAMMDHAPHDFIINFKPADSKPFTSFKHRTFNGVDLLFFMKALQYIYTQCNGLESAMSKHPNDMPTNLYAFRTLFFSIEGPERTKKHLANPLSGSAAKRLNMFLRWMVRNDKAGVDFGLWKSLQPAQLYVPLDVHSGNVARKLGLLQRKQNDWKAVEELTQQLRTYDPNDPVKYDYALFGLGVFEGF